MGLGRLRQVEASPGTSGYEVGVDQTDLAVVQPIVDEAGEGLISSRLGAVDDLYLHGQTSSTVGIIIGRRR